MTHSVMPVFSNWDMFRRRAKENTTKKKRTLSARRMYNLIWLMSREESGTFLHISDKCIPFGTTAQINGVHPVTHVKAQGQGQLVAHFHTAAVTRHNLFVGMFVTVAFPARGIHTVVFRTAQIQVADLVVTYHIGPDLVTVHRIGKVDHIGGVSARRPHVDLQRYIVALLS